MSDTDRHDHALRRTFILWASLGLLALFALAAVPYAFAPAGF
jgi:hypothetical protein